MFIGLDALRAGLTRLLQYSISLMATFFYKVNAFGAIKGNFVRKIGQIAKGYSTLGSIEEHSNWIFV
jgi:hypothetical protein